MFCRFRPGASGCPRSRPFSPFSIPVLAPVLARIADAKLWMFPFCLPFCLPFVPSFTFFSSHETAHSGLIDRRVSLHLRLGASAAPDCGRQIVDVPKISPR
jgi:hypothetical protein